MAIWNWFSLLVCAKLFEEPEGVERYSFESRSTPSGTLITCNRQDGSIWGHLPPGYRRMWGQSVF